MLITTTNITNLLSTNNNNDNNNSVTKKNKIQLTPKQIFLMCIYYLELAAHHQFLLGRFFFLPLETEIELLVTKPPRSGPTNFSALFFVGPTKLSNNYSGTDFHSKKGSKNLDPQKKGFQNFHTHGR